MRTAATLCVLSARTPDGGPGKLSRKNDEWMCLPEQQSLVLTVHHNKKVVCGEGYYRSATPTSAQVICTECPVDKYRPASSQGNQACLGCPIGQSQPRPGRTKCFAPDGSSPTHVPTMAPTRTPTFYHTDMPTVYPTAGPTQAPTSNPTPTPTPQPTSTPSHAPTPACTPGKFALPKLRCNLYGCAMCEECPCGKFSKYYGSSFCISCAKGEFTGPSATECLSCPPGKFSPHGNATVQRMAHGHAALPTQNSKCGCPACKAGRFAEMHMLPVWP
jgi:hypothetical protein